jgi:hypothetical protein
MFHEWHVVSNSEGEILGVYGSALLSEAQGLCQRIQAGTGRSTYLHNVLANVRPSVGSSISMLGRVNRVTGEKVY